MRSSCLGKSSVSREASKTSPPISPSESSTLHFSRISTGQLVNSMPPILTLATCVTEVFTLALSPMPPVCVASWRWIPRNIAAAREMVMPLAPVSICSLRPLPLNLTSSPQPTK